MSHAIKIEDLDLSKNEADKLELVCHNFLSDIGYSNDRIEDTEELKKVIAMIEYIGPRTIEQVDGSEDFTTCDICGLLASTIDINIYER